MHTILGAGGAIGGVLVRELSAKGEPIRIVSRRAQMVEGAKEAVAADLSGLQATVDAVAGSTVVYLVAGLKYDSRVWQDLWPKIMHNTIEACKRSKAKLIFLDNVYMYGRVKGAMTEETPFNPCSKKGEVRARIATILLDEIKAGNLTALIARAADFYGPGARTGVANILVFDNLARGAKASMLVNASMKHSYSFAPDVGKCLALLAGSQKSWNQTWHVPTASPPPTGKEFVEMAAREFGVQPRYRLLSKGMTRLAGLFDVTVREVYEMLYQNDSDYVFDSTKFVKAFDCKPTPYTQGIKLTAAAYR